MARTAPSMTGVKLCIITTGGTSVPRASIPSSTAVQARW